MDFVDTDYATRESEESETSSRRNDFAGADDYYDLWIFDEFHQQEQEEMPEPYTTMGGDNLEGSPFLNNLLKVLDGQECRLDSKYARIFKKKRNVPIIMIANKLPRLMEKHGPFRARFFRIRFTTQIKKLEEDRIIATLWGCLLRRAIKSPYAEERETPKEVALAYNVSRALIVTLEEGETTEEEEWEKAITKVKNPIGTRKEDKDAVDKVMRWEPMLITREGEIYKLKPKISGVKKGYSIIIFEILKTEEEQWGEQKSINLLNFASIPIKKNIQRREVRTEKEA